MSGSRCSTIAGAPPHEALQLKLGSLRRAACLALAGAAVVALSLPALALGQSGAPTLTDATDTGYPDRVYQLLLPTARTLTADQVTVTENGDPVGGRIGIEAPGATSGVVLLIDASLSMKGEPIEQAMAAARAFMKVRPEAMPVAVIAFNPEQHVLTDFTTDSAVLNQAVATTPEIVYGTEIYDSLILRVRDGDGQRPAARHRRPALGRERGEQRVRRGRHSRGTRGVQHARHLGRLQVGPLQPERA